MKRIMIMGATSGIGLDLALLYIAKGYIVGVAGRRKYELEALKSIAPDRVFYQQIDITGENAPLLADGLVKQMGGMDIYFHSSGIGYFNNELKWKEEINTLNVNGIGFTRMLDWAFLYFEAQGYGQIGAISSIAGTRGIGVAPAYSATKAYQQNYLQALAHKANILQKKISITDIRPGFVKTDLLKGGKYPMMMTPQKVAFLIHDALQEKRRIATIDGRYRILVAIWKMIPNRWYEHISIKVK